MSFSENPFADDGAVTDVTPTPVAHAPLIDPPVDAPVPCFTAPYESVLSIPHNEYAYNDEDDTAHDGPPSALMGNNANPDTDSVVQLRHELLCATRAWDSEAPRMEAEWQSAAQARRDAARSLHLCAVSASEHTPSAPLSTHHHTLFPSTNEDQTACNTAADARRRMLSKVAHAYDDFVHQCGTTQTPCASSQLCSMCATTTHADEKRAVMLALQWTNALMNRSGNAHEIEDEAHVCGVGRKRERSRAEVRAPHTKQTTECGELVRLPCSTLTDEGEVAKERICAGATTQLLEQQQQNPSHSSSSTADSLSSSHSHHAEDAEHPHHKDMQSADDAEYVIDAQELASALATLQSSHGPAHSSSNCGSNADALLGCDDGEKDVPEHEMALIQALVHRLGQSIHTGARLRVREDRAEHTLAREEAALYEMGLHAVELAACVRQSFLDESVHDGPTGTEQRCGNGDASSSAAAEARLAEGCAYDGAAGTLDVMEMNMENRAMQREAEQLTRAVSNLLAQYRSITNSNSNSDDNNSVLKQDSIDSSHVNHTNHPTNMKNSGHHEDDRHETADATKTSGAVCFTRADSTLTLPGGEEVSDVIAVACVALEQRVAEMQADCVSIAHDVLSGRRALAAPALDEGAAASTADAHAHMASVHCAATEKQQRAAAEAFDVVLQTRLSRLRQLAKEYADESLRAGDASRVADSGICPGHAVHSDGNAHHTMHPDKRSNNMDSIHSHDNGNNSQESVNAVKLDEAVDARDVSRHDAPHVDMGRSEHTDPFPRATHAIHAYDAMLERELLVTLQQRILVPALRKMTRCHASLQRVTTALMWAAEVLTMVRFGTVAKAVCMPTAIAAVQERLREVWREVVHTARTDDTNNPNDTKSATGNYDDVHDAASGCDEADVDVPESDAKEEDEGAQRWRQQQMDMWAARVAPRVRALRTLRNELLRFINEDTRASREAAACEPAALTAAQQRDALCETIALTQAEQNIPSSPAEGETQADRANTNEANNEPVVRVCASDVRHYTALAAAALCDSRRIAAARLAACPDRVDAAADSLDIVPSDEELRQLREACAEEERQVCALEEQLRQRDRTVTMAEVE